MNKKKLLAGVLTIIVTMESVGMSEINVNAAEETGRDKEEVVYIITDAQGNVENVNVVNIFGKGDVTDYGNYSSVKMLNTTDAIDIEGDKVTFSTDKDKVYYQGTLENAQIPWIITLQYVLDGKEITADELAGKSGKLEIHIKMEKNDKCTTEFYDNYALQAAFLLNSETCKNLKADGATLANVGVNKQVSYTVLPGKGLDAVITSDVTNFEMEAATINGVKLDLNMDIDDGELMSKVTDIMNASSDLNDGAAEISDGTEALVDGGGNLMAGATTMNQGVNSLNQGINTLNTGVTTMQTALNELNSQSATLTEGSAQVLTALKTIQLELSKVSMSTEQLKQLTESSAAIKQGIAEIYNGAVTLQNNLSYEAYKEKMKAGGLDMEQLQAGNTEAINSLSTQINELSVTVEQLKSMPDYESNETYKAQVAQLETQINSLKNIITLLGGNNAAINGTSQYFNATALGASELVTGIGQLNSSYETFDTAIVTLGNTLSDLAVNMATLKTGIDQLVTSYTTLDTGINDYTDGVASIVAAYSQLVTGSGTLLEGSKELVTGSADLRQGTVHLYDGLVSLNGGAKELNDGTKEFYQKTDGMDSKVEATMDDTLNALTGGDFDVVSFVSDKNKNVKTVQFVIKTSAIEKAETVHETSQETQKLNFGEKILRLFKIKNK